MFLGSKLEYLQATSDDVDGGTIILQRRGQHKANAFRNELGRDCGNEKAHTRPSPSDDCNNTIDAKQVFWLQRHGRGK